ncbi:integrin alpha-11-like, partial [Clarias magur]
YTVTSVVSARSGQLYVAGAPRFNHTGKVIIFTLKNTGELNILHSLKGNQIGSYYGSEIAAVDIDGDGVTDNLLVAAPMFFSGGWERGKVYIYRINDQPRFILEGVLELTDISENARFGSALAPVSDLNGDSFNDLVVGAPLEDEHRGVIYIYNSQRNRILRKYKQRISAAELASGLQYFGRSIHGKMDMNGDGLVDLAVGSLGAAVLLWSRSVIRIHAAVRFEPSKVNIFNKDCRRNGKDVTCMSAIVCLNVTARTVIRPTQEVGLWSNTYIEEKRFNPRAVMDDLDRQQPQNLTLLPGEEHCEHIYFHVMETTDYARPIIFTVETGLQDPNNGPTLDDTWPTTTRTQLPFWNGCDEDDHCVPDLVIQSQTDLISRKQFCGQVFRVSSALCLSQTETQDNERVIEASRKKMVVDVRLENRGENAYGARLNISYSRNLQFSSLILKDNSDIQIDCRSGDKQRNEKYCDVGAPFMRAKTQVTFRLEFEFISSVLLDHVRVILAAGSDGEEVALHDNNNDIFYKLRYESDLLFTRDSNPSHWELKANLGLEKAENLRPPFNFTFQIQNLGYFPVRNLQLNIMIPEVTKNGNRFLQIQQLHIDQVDGTHCIPPQHVAHSRATPEDLSRVSHLNYTNSLAVPVQCNLNLSSYREVTVRISGSLRVDSLHELKFKTLELVTTASVELSQASPMFLQEERPVRHAFMSQRIMSHSMHERALAQFRRQEERREDEHRRVAKEKQIQANLKTEERVEMKRYLRMMQDEEYERQMEEAFLKAEQDRIYKEKVMEQEERMAKELARISYEKMRDEKMRQYIKENSVEIRELEAKLKSAYLNRARAAQIAEKEAVRYEAMKEEADIACRMKSELERAAIEEEKQEQRRYEELVLYQQELEKQLEEKERKRQESYEEFLKEKLMVDEIVRKIYEEDRKKHELRLEMVTSTQRYIQEFKKQQAEWKRLEREKMEEENRRILEYAKYQEWKEQDRMASARKRETAKENLYKMLTEKIEIEQRQQEEMERVREELYLEEQEEAARQKEIKDMERRIRQRLELQQTYQEQLAFKQLRLQAEKDEEETFRQMMLAKFAEDDRIEQMNAQKRRMKQQEHKRAVEKLIEERRRKYLADKEREAEERAMEQEREAQRRQIIEEERLKLLKLHATQLLGYLPK